MNMAQLGASITGNVETALLVIHDYRSVAPTMPKAEMNELQKMAHRMEEKVKLTMDLIQSMLDAGNTDRELTFMKSTTKIFKVQFNPSSIRLNSSAMTTNKRDAAGNITEELVTEDPVLTMTTKLQFNDMHIFDSFMGDKVAAATNIPLGTAKLVAYAVESKKKTWSVQEEVEAIIGALRDPLTRCVSLRWADFVFIGQLNSVQANYTMFSNSGRPVRAEVMLRLQHEMDADLLVRWKSDFDKLFDLSNSSSSLVRKGAGMGNVLNLVF